MRLGDTFIVAGGQGHLLILLSAPESFPDKLILVSLTSWHQKKDSACELGPSDHPWIRHRTLVGYRHARVTSLKTLARQIRSNMVSPHPDPASSRMMRKILDGAKKSRTLPNEVKRALLDQGLIS